MKTVKIGFLGLGNVGTGACKVLEMNKAEIEAATETHVEIAKVLVQDITKKRDTALTSSQFTQNADDILNNPEISIVVELMGGVEPATTLMLSAMKNKKHVVTANKAAIAENYDKLMKCAKDNGVMFKFEASVGGGIPIINAVSTVLRGNKFVEVMGIVNGTTNYMLTQMTDNGLAYDDVLKIAQEKGFAEPDPTADVEGFDAANKLTVLMALMFDKYVHPDDIPTEGISKITKEQIEDAKAKGCKIKLIANAKNVDGKIEYSVKPTLLKNDHPLAGVNNEFNAVFVTGNAVDSLMFYGRGAGPLPTGSAVIGDVISIIQAMR